MSLKDRIRRREHRALTPVAEAAEVERIPGEGALIELGQWYWQKTEDGDRLGCVTHIGSNYLRLAFPSRYSSSTRVHMDEFPDLRFESNPHACIQERVDHFKGRVEAALEDVKAITARLGVSTRVGIASRQDAPQASSRALSTVSGTADPKAYRGALTKAKEEDLPALFKQMKEDNEMLSVWMRAEALPLEALSESMKGCIDEVGDRIFAVDLYAGLTEKIVQFADGEPADFGDKLHVMQRRCYMDEECLLDYHAGGMDFKSIGKFNEWLAKPKNRNRILPYPRCMVAFRVRREKKEREFDGSLSEFIRIVDAEAADTQTYLYIRNGERLYMLRCALSFGEKTFPEPGVCDPAEPLMLKRDGGNLKFMTRREYDHLCARLPIEKAEWERQEKERDAWFKEHAGPEPEEEQFQEGPDDTVLYRDEVIRFSDLADAKDDSNIFGWYTPEAAWERDRCHVAYLWRHNAVWNETCKKAPYGGRHHKTPADFEAFRPRAWRGEFFPEDWKPFDDGTVYYDDGLQQVAAEIKQYNRVALIIQGLFDRSEVLHPHPPVQTWTADGFAAAVRLVYDASGTLHDGDKPDFEAYWTECNKHLGPGAVTIGQDEFWQEKEAEKECDRRDRNWRDNGNYRPERFKPHGNPGPGHLARIAKWYPRVRKALFAWGRERRSVSVWNERPDIYTTIKVPENRLFCVDGYQQGDYLRFFKDPRTRAEYLKWAPFLLAAEDYVCGKRTPREPVRKEDLT